MLVFICLILFGLFYSFFSFKDLFFPPRKTYWINTEKGKVFINNFYYEPFGNMFVVAKHGIKDEFFNTKNEAKRYIEKRQKEIDKWSSDQKYFTKKGILFSDTLKKIYVWKNNVYDIKEYKL